MYGDTEHSHKREALKITLRALATLGVIALLAVAGWLVVQQLAPPWSGNDQRPTPDEGQQTLGGIEGIVLGAYLRVRQGDLQQPAGDDDTPLDFTVEPGESIASIASRLQQAGLIRDAGLFRNYVRYMGLDAGIQAGHFTLRKTMTIPEIAKALGYAAADELVFRIIEGWRLEQIAEAISATLKPAGAQIDPQEFLTLARTGAFDYDFLQDRPAGATLEGFLFPDTYRLDRGTTARALIEKMLANFGARVTPELRQGIAQQGLNLYQGVIIASIVEREAVIPEERPLIASVYLNRLKIGMKLDADPTVQYALGYQKDTGEWWKRPLLLADLEMDSPYNTYRHPGLPPGPIANPGLDAIRAVAHPAETDFLYFQADCDGSGRHRFARTIEEHFANNCP